VGIDMRITKILVAITAAITVSFLGIQQASATTYSEKTVLSAVGQHVTTSISKHSVGPNVYAIQLSLWHQGFLKGSKSSVVDGSFGPKTKAAVIAFQKATASWHPAPNPRLVPDGEVGPKTWDVLWNHCVASEAPTCAQVYKIYQMAP
jgi:hypothetical protein